MNAFFFTFLIGAGVLSISSIDEPTTSTVTGEPSTPLADEWGALETTVASGAAELARLEVHTGKEITRRVDVIHRADLEIERAVDQWVRTLILEPSESESLQMNFVEAISRWREERTSMQRTLASLDDRMRTITRQTGSSHTPAQASNPPLFRKTLREQAAEMMERCFREAIGLAASSREPAREPCLVRVLDLKIPELREYIESSHLRGVRVRCSDE